MKNSDMPEKQWHARPSGRKKKTVSIPGGVECYEWHLSDLKFHLKKTAQSKKKNQIVQIIVTIIEPPNSLLFFLGNVWIWLGFIEGVVFFCFFNRFFHGVWKSHYKNQLQIVMSIHELLGMTMFPTKWRAKGRNKVRVVTNPYPHKKKLHRTQKCGLAREYVLVPKRVTHLGNPISIFYGLVYEFHHFW